MSAPDPRRESLRRAAEPEWHINTVMRSVETVQSWYALVVELERASRLREDYQLRCQECGAPHWFDTSIPSEVWNRIAPEGGVLCLLCIDARLAKAGLKSTARFYFVGAALDSDAYPDEPLATPRVVKEALDLRDTALRDLAEARAERDFVVDLRNLYMRERDELAEALREMMDEVVMPGGDGGLSVATLNKARTTLARLAGDAGEKSDG